MTQRFKLLIEYDGSEFVGWQHQENGFSVQEAIETAIKNFSNETPRLHCAGRTDAGVHALGQVAHVDMEREITAFRLTNAINANLRPHRVSILNCEKVGDEFSARFNATARHYEYRIINRRSPLTLDNGKAWWVPSKLNALDMHNAAQVFIGEHDFTTFRNTRCQAKSPVKSIDKFSISRYGEMIVAEVSAQSFLHNQVRAMVGTLKLVGAGKWTKEDVEKALKAKDRKAAGVNAPSEGLYLKAVSYD
jgi:tRNA pseudouridine38-40 synthase